jgi:hypothetical protein
MCQALRYNSRRGGTCFQYREGGISLSSFDPKDPKTTPNRVDQINVYLIWTEQGPPFAGQLSGGLEREHTREDVHALWGTPTWVFELADPPSDRYDSEKAQVWFNYGAGASGIEVITLVSLSRSA